MGGWAHKRTRAPSGRVDGAGHAGRTSKRGRTMGGRADNGRTGGQWADGRIGGRGGGRADRLADWRTGERADGGGRADDGFPKVKLPI